MIGLDEVEFKFNQSALSIDANEGCGNFKFYPVGVQSIEKTKESTLIG